MFSGNQYARKTVQEKAAVVRGMKDEVEGGASNAFKQAKDVLGSCPSQAS